MQLQYLHVLVFLVIGIAIGVAAFSASRLLQSRGFDPKKGMSYECGMEPIGSPWISMNIRFYIFALIFVLFDVEAIFLFPWAVKFREIGWPGFIAMFLFVDILVVGLVYAWRKGALKWQ